MQSRATRLFVVLASVCIVSSARADVDFSGPWRITEQAYVGGGNPAPNLGDCHWDVVVVGSNVTMTETCPPAGLLLPIVLPGTVDATTGAFHLEGALPDVSPTVLCQDMAYDGTISPDSRSLTFSATCLDGTPHWVDSISGTGSRCRNDAVDFGEVCDSGPCCNLDCSPKPVDTVCDRLFDCQPSRCDASAQCVFAPVTGNPCADDDPCTSDECDGNGTCIPSPTGFPCDLDGDACTDDYCDGTGQCFPHGCSLCCGGPLPGPCVPALSSGCTAASTPRSSLKVPPTGRTLSWTWARGDANPLEFAYPTSSMLCVFDEPGGTPRLLYGARLSALHKENSSLFFSKSGEPAGLRRAIFKFGAGSAKIKISAKSRDASPLGGFGVSPVVPPVTVQHYSGAGLSCRQSVFPTSHGSGLGFVGKEGQ